MILLFVGKKEKDIEKVSLERYGSCHKIGTIHFFAPAVHFNRHTVKTMFGCWER